MSSQGLIAIVKHNTVIMKVFTGSNGHGAHCIAQKIKKAWPLSLRDVYQLAKKEQFGEPSNLVVLEKNKGIFGDTIHHEDDQIFPELYFNTFHITTFNPRWECGESRFTEVVTI